MGILPEDHKHDMSEGAPTGSDNLEERVGVWCIQLLFGSNLEDVMRSTQPFGRYRGTYLSEEKDLNRGSCTIPPRSTNSIPVRHGTAL
jgi:hypothetical protein